MTTATPMPSGRTWPCSTAPAASPRRGSRAGIVPAVRGEVEEAEALQPAGAGQPLNARLVGLVTQKRGDAVRANQSGDRGDLSTGAGKAQSERRAGQG